MLHLDGKGWNDKNTENIIENINKLIQDVGTSKVLKSRDSNTKQ